MISQRIFEDFFGNINNYVFLTLLPSYREQKNSSLICMVVNFVKQSGKKESGFYVNSNRLLLKEIEKLIAEGGKRILLWGVTYALLDLAEIWNMNLSDIIIMETGGMKGRRKELVRDEVHEILMNKFRVDTIYSEYGMTELLSQAYSTGKGIFRGPAWTRVMLRDINDPFYKNNEIKFGGINFIDLSNIHSCAFIETEDLGRKSGNESFEVIGRMDNSDIRGCNLILN